MGVGDISSPIRRVGTKVAFTLVHEISASISHSYSNLLASVRLKVSLSLRYKLLRRFVIKIYPSLHNTLVDSRARFSAAELLLAANDFVA